MKLHCLPASCLPTCLPAFCINQRPQLIVQLHELLQTAPNWLSLCNFNGSIRTKYCGSQQAQRQAEAEAKAEAEVKVEADSGRQARRQAGGQDVRQECLLIWRYFNTINTAFWLICFNCIISVNLQLFETAVINCDLCCTTSRPFLLNICLCLIQKAGRQAGSSASSFASNIAVSESIFIEYRPYPLRRQAEV